MYIADLIAALELAPPWLLIAFGSIGMIAVCYAILIILPQPEN